MSLQNVLLKTMSFCNQDKNKRNMTYIGLMIINLTGGMIGWYGNLYTYIDSYLLVKVGVDPSECARLTTGSYLFCWSISMTIYKKAFRCVHNRILSMVSLLIADLSFLMGYWTVQISPGAVVFSLGVCMGIASGTMDAMGFVYFSLWSRDQPANLGLMTAVVCGTSIGPIVFNVAITRYINPWNWEADQATENRRYFSQLELLDRVPSLFLLMASISSLLHATGFFLIKDRNESFPSVEKGSANPVNVQNDANISGTEIKTEHARLLTKSVGECSSNCLAKNYSSRHHVGPLDNNDTVNHGSHSGTTAEERRKQPQVDRSDTPEALSHSLSANSSKDTPLHASVERDCIHQRVCKTPMKTLACEISRVFKKTIDKTEEKNMYKENEDSEKSDIFKKSGFKANDHSPSKHSQREATKMTKASILDILRQKHFIAIWIGTGSGIFVYSSLDSFYKMFSQSRLTDDHFLSYVGPMTHFFYVTGRMGWGALSDALGVKACTIGFLAGNVLTMAWLYFIPSFGGIVFLAYMCVATFFTSGVYGIYPAAILKYFGPESFSTVYGLSTSSLLVGAVAFPQVTGVMLTHFGWWGVFQCIGFLNALALVINVILLPNRG